MEDKMRNFNFYQLIGSIPIDFLCFLPFLWNLKKCVYELVAYKNLKISNYGGKT